MDHRVFVYGTLLRGERNHAYLRGARFLGPWRTPPRFSLWALASYPVACANGTDAIHGEVYRVSERILRQLDCLEEVPDYYRRSRIQTAWGLAWIYLQDQPPEGARRLAAGQWRRRRSRVLQRLGFEAVSATQAAT